jgi:hypothetical protein
MNAQAVGTMKPTVQSSEETCPWHQQDEACARLSVTRGVRQGGGRIPNKLQHSGRNEDREPSAQPNGLRIAENWRDRSAWQHSQHRVGHVDRPDVAGASPNQITRVESGSGAKLQYLAAVHIARKAADGG